MSKKLLFLMAAGVVCSICVVPVAWSQCPWELFQTFAGEADSDYFGLSVSGAGDVNNDGYDDLIVGAGSGAAGRAYVFSGFDAETIHVFTGEAALDGFGYHVSGAGDVNNDGYDDLIVGATGNDAGGSDAGRAYVYSGQTGGLLWIFTGEATGDRLGYSVSGAGDVDDDGYDDVIVGAIYNSAGAHWAGRAYVFSGQTGAVLWTFTGGEEDGAFGWSVSGAGDVNNDGYDDLIVGAPLELLWAGRAYLYCGQTGALLRTFTGWVAQDQLGYSVSGAGDVNNDGCDDVIVGATFASSDTGQAYVFSVQGVLLWSFTGEAEWDNFGRSVSGAGDVDNDGYDDIIVGAPGNDAGGSEAGCAYVYSGQTGGLLWSFIGKADSSSFGLSVSGAGDVNDDGSADLIVGAPFKDASGSLAGRAYVYSGRTDVLCFNGEAAGDRLGFSVSGAGDVNDDGYDDLIIGAYHNSAGGEDAGRAYVHSGQTGALLWTFTGEAAYDRLGLSVSGAGDVNNDGYADLIVGAYWNDGGGEDAGRAYVFSGLDAETLHVFTGEAAGDWLGISVSGAGNVDNDGHDDLIVGAYRNDAGGHEAGRAYVYSGQTGAVLWTFTGEAAGDWLGHSVSGAGDVDNDGYDDLIVGAHYNDAGGENAGRVYVFSGFDGDTLYVFTGEAEEDVFGYEVSGAGDVNNDGYADLIVGAPQFPASDSGLAYVYSGQTGAVLWTFVTEEADNQFGTSVSGAGDVNDDGYDDLIVGAYYDAVDTNAGRAYVFSGRSGSVLCTFDGEAAHDGLGCSVSGAGDVNNDGYDEVIVGAAYNDAGGEDAGRAYVFSCQVEDPFVRGDANGDGIIDLGDAVHILNYLFKGGPAPDPLEAGDANCDGVVDLADAVYILNYLFKGGPEPSC